MLIEMSANQNFLCFVIFVWVCRSLTMRTKYVKYSYNGECLPTSRIKTVIDFQITCIQWWDVFVQSPHHGHNQVKIVIGFQITCIQKLVSKTPWVKCMMRCVCSVSASWSQPGKTVRVGSFFQLFFQHSNKMWGKSSDFLFLLEILISSSVYMYKLQLLK